MNSSQSINSTNIVPVILSLLLIVAGIVFVFGQVQEYPAKSTEISEATQRVNERQEKYNTLTSLNFSELQDLGQKADVALPSEKKFPGLLSGLEALAQEAGSDLITFDTAPRLISGPKRATPSAQIMNPAPENVAEQSLGILFLEAVVGVNSNAASLIDLTQTLVKSSRVVTMEKIEFETQESAGIKKVNTNIVLRVYFQPDNATAAANIKFAPVSEEEKSIISKVDSFNRFNLDLPTSLPSLVDPFASQEVVPPESNLPESPL